MKRKQFLFLLLIVAVLGGIGLATYRQQEGSWGKEPDGAGKKLLGDLPLNDIAAISIRQGTNEVNLVKKGDAWGVLEYHDYPADFPHISDFLLKLRDLKAVQTEKASAAELPRWQLAPDAGTKGPIVIQFKRSDGTPFQTLLLGKQHRYGAGAAGSDGEGIADGRYMRLSDSDEVVLTSVPLNNIWTVPDAWLNQDFFSVKRPKSITVTNPVTANSWKIFRETASGEWKAGDAGKKLDLQKAEEIATAFGWATFADVQPGNELENQKSLRMDIETFDGFHYTVHIGQKANNNYPITVSVAAQFPPAPPSGKEGKSESKAPELQKQQLETKLKKEQMCADWTYLVAATTVEPILKGPFQISASTVLPLPHP